MKHCGRIFIMHSLGLMTFAVLMAAILNGEVSAETTAPPKTIRLVDGSRISEGRLEVFFLGQWGTVCNNLWTLREAKVACKQLGYVGADSVFYEGDKFGEGVGQILLDRVQCEGTENDLFECGAGVSSTPCDHSEDIGVACTVTNSIRLAEGSSFRQGKVEMLADTGEWGKVCAQDWDPDETVVACKQLGRPNIINYFNQVDQGMAFTAEPGPGPFVTGGFQCIGDEDRLDNCTQADNWAPDNCQEGEISVTCSPNTILQTNGAILVSYGGDIGTICPGENWDMNAARVACRNLGHKDAIKNITVEFRTSTGYTVLLYNPRCSGDETFYTECDSVQWAYQGDCAAGNTDRAGAICELQEPDVRIENESPYPEIGRVEMSISTQDQYLMICNRAWNIQVAHVVCIKMGYDGGAAQIFSTSGTMRTDQQVITGLDCPEGAFNLSACTIDTMYAESAEDCDLDQVAGVACSADDNMVPLVGGSSTSEGVLEYKISGLPALICDPDWSEKEAMVACRMHGYESGNVTGVVSLGHSRDSFPYSFENYNYTCSGAEATLAECQMETIEDDDACDPEDIVQVTCQPNKDWDLRLVGSTSSEQGRVEVFLGGEWASIMYDGILLTYLADDLCQLLGFKEFLDHAFDSALGAGGENPFGAGTGKVLKCDYVFPTRCEDDLSEVAEDDTRSDVSVVCLPYGTVENHPVRLVSETGMANNETGRVEILHDGEWGSVCDSGTGFIRTVDRVVCTELGYTDLQYAKHLDEEKKEPFLTGDEMIWFTSDYCSESRLYTCYHGPWGQHPEDCSPSVVTCVPDDDDDDDANAGPSLLHAHRTGLIIGAVIMVLLIIAV